MSVFSYPTFQPEVKGLRTPSHINNCKTVKDFYSSSTPYTEHARLSYPTGGGSITAVGWGASRRPHTGVGETTWSAR
jgi:hypothetical protein